MWKGASSHEPEVAPLDPAAIDPADFTKEEVGYAYPLVHLAALANGVILDGPALGPGEAQAGDRPRGFIDLKGVAARARQPATASRSRPGRSSRRSV